MPKQKTIKAFDVWKLDAKNWDEFFRLIVEDGLRLRDAAVKLKQPYTLVYPFIHDGGEMEKRYTAALKAVARDHMDETVPIADSVRKTTIPARVAAAKLAIEARQVYAAKADRERFGDVVRIEKEIKVTADAGLIGVAGDLLRLVKKPAPAALPGRVFENEATAGMAEAIPEREALCKPTG